MTTVPPRSGKPRKKAPRGNSTLTFIVRWLRSPRHMGAVAPSSRGLARAMAAQIPHDVHADQAPVVELGGGTGSITRGLLEAGIPLTRLIVVERDKQLAALLRRRFPGLKVLCGDAARLDELLAEAGVDRIASIVSGLPLLLFPEPVLHRLIDGAFAMLGPDRPFIQFTYGFGVPLPAGRTGLAARRVAWVLGNVPPAFVWVFNRPIKVQ